MNAPHPPPPPSSLSLPLPLPLHCYQVFGMHACSTCMYFSWNVTDWVVSGIFLYFFLLFPPFWMPYDTYENIKNVLFHTLSPDKRTWLLVGWNSKQVMRLLWNLIIAQSTWSGITNAGLICNTKNWRSQIKTMILFLVISVKGGRSLEWKYTYTYNWSLKFNHQKLLWTW